MHYTQKEIEKSDFLFISYSHTDQVAVEEVVSFLYEKGVRCWYDTDMHIGDDWTEIAYGLIRHPNCKGVIFFNSANSFKSRAVHLERVCTQERNLKEKEQGNKFYNFAVYINSTSPSLVIQQVFQSLPSESAIIEQKFPLEWLKTITELFSNKTLYCCLDRNGPEQCANQLFEAIQDKIPGAVDLDYLRMKQLEQKANTAKFLLHLGVCKHQYMHEVPSYLLTKNGVITLKNEKVLVQDGQGYSTKPIIWSPLYCENDLFVLLSNVAVDVRYGGPGLHTWLQEEFFQFAFDETTKGYIRELRLLSEADIGKITNGTPETVLFADGEEGHWWLADSGKNGVRRQKTIRNRDGKMDIYETGYPYTTTKSKVRPVIVIHKDQLLELNFTE